MSFDRRQTRQLKVGDVAVGGGAEIAVQHIDTGAIQGILPLRSNISDRVLALTPGRGG